MRNAVHFSDKYPWLLSQIASYKDLPRRGWLLPSEAELSGSSNLPWAHQNIFQNQNEIKHGINRAASRGRANACSRAAIRPFVRIIRCSVTAATAVERKRRGGGSIRHSKNTARPSQGKKNGGSRAADEGNAARPKKRLPKRLGPARG